jgi:hypothetical protein
MSKSYKITKHDTTKGRNHVYVEFHYADGEKRTVKFDANAPTFPADNAAALAGFLKRHMAAYEAGKTTAVRQGDSSGVDELVGKTQEVG